MQRDIAAIVDIGAIERRGGHHRAKDFLRDASGHRRHRRDEAIGGKGRHGRMHPPRDDAAQLATRCIGGAAQMPQLRAELIKQAGEASRGRGIGRAHIRLASVRFHDEVNGAVLQMQPLAVGEKSCLRKPVHARRPGICGIGRSSAWSFSDASGRT